jgi:hypothetical protein
VDNFLNKSVEPIRHCIKVVCFCFHSISPPCRRLLPLESLRHLHTFS